jgi:hypothetical protein
LSYAGDITKGIYSWGATLVQTTNTPPSDSVIPYDQTGEDRMESVFSVWRDTPLGGATPRSLLYKLTRNGVSLITGNYLAYATVNSAGTTITSNLPNPVFIYYRKDAPDMYGDTYDATATYAVDDQVFFTDSNDNSDYYKCTAAASAGDTPATDPDKWTALTIPEPLFWSSVWNAYADSKVQERNDGEKHAFSFRSRDAETARRYGGILHAGLYGDSAHGYRIAGETMQAAIQIVEWFDWHRQKVVGFHEGEKEAKQMKKLQELKARFPRGFTLRDVCRKRLAGDDNRQKNQELLDRLVEKGEVLGFPEGDDGMLYQMP